MRHPTDGSTRPPPAPGWARAALAHLLLSYALPRRIAAALHARIAADAAWSAYYAALRRIERAPSGVAFSASQTDLVLDLVMDGLDRAPGPQPARPARWAFPTGALAGACAAAVVFFVAARPDDADAWRARGVEDAPHVGLRARCIDKVARKIVDQAEAGPRMLDDVLSCPRGSLVSFSLTNLEPAPFFAYVVGVAADGALRFYSPFEEDKGSIEARPGDVDRVLDVAADTASLPQDASVSLFVLFSERPVHGADVARALRGARDRALPVRAFDRLPLAGYTSRIELRAR